MSDMIEGFLSRYWEKNSQQEMFRHLKALEWLTPESAPVVDIGCGDGYLLQELQKRGIQAWGMDVSNAAIASCRARGLEVEQVDFADGKFSDRTARTAVILDVLEHVFEPDRVLTACHSHVDQVLISVPNFGSLPARLQVLQGKVPENNTPKKGHVYWFTHSVLCDVLQRTGWKIERLEVNTPWMRVKGIGPVMKFLGKKWPGLFGLSFLVFAKKNV